MNVTATTLPLHHRGLYDVINMYPKTKPNAALRIVGGRVLSTKELYEELQLVSGLGPAVNIKEAGGIPFDEITAPYSKKFYPSVYALGFEISPQARNKDVYGALKNPGRHMAMGHYVADQQAGADLINNVASASYTGIDGVALASASHPTSASTWSNISTAASLSVSALETGVTNLMTQKAYRDPIIWPQDGPFRLIVPPALTVTAKRILASIQQPGTANNDKNVVREVVNEVVTSPYITSTTNWALVAQGDDNPLFCLKAGDLQIMEDMDARIPSYLFVAMKEYVYGWKLANGFQNNAGA